MITIYDPLAAGKLFECGMMNAECGIDVSAAPTDHIFLSYRTFYFLFVVLTNLK